MSAFESPSLGLEITEICNFACVHCYLERVMPSKVTYELVKRVTEVAAEFDFSHIYITGGEPTIHPEFPEIYRRVRGMGFITEVFSNGSNLSPKILDVYTELPPSLLEITLYGGSEETYFATTGRRGQFEKVVKNIRTLHERGVEIALKYQLLKETAEDLPRYLDLAESVGSPVLVSGEVVPMLNGNLSPLGHRIPPEQMAKISLEYGFDFVGGPEITHRCNAGDQMFINSQGRLKGCPILNMENDISLADGEDVAAAMTRTRKLFDDFHAKKNNTVCQAWTDLEGSNGVKTYIGQIKSRLDAAVQS